MPGDCSESFDRCTLDSHAWESGRPVARDPPLGHDGAPSKSSRTFCSVVMSRGASVPPYMRAGLSGSLEIEFESPEIEARLVSQARSISVAAPFTASPSITPR